MLLNVLIVTIILVGLAFAGIAVKIIFTKKGEFKKSCASVDPVSGERYGCSCGSEDGVEACRNKEKVES
jgi:hypothetical protein